MSSLQQINLLRPEFRPQKPPFSFDTMLMSLAAMLLFLVMLQLWGWYQTESAKEQLAMLQGHQLNVLQELANIRASTPQNREAQLDAEIRIAEAEIERRRQILSIMAGQDTGNASGFSEHLISLSRQHMDGLSLEHFRLSQGGDYVELSGWSYRAEFVPDYARRLSVEDVFQHARFGDMVIERVAEQRTDALRFSFDLADRGEP